MKCDAKVTEAMMHCQKNRTLCGMNTSKKCGNTRIFAKNYSSCWTASSISFFLISTLLLSSIVTVYSNRLPEESSQILSSMRQGAHSHQPSRHVLSSRRSEHIHEPHQKPPNTYLNQFAVNINGNDQTALQIAKRYGFIFKGMIANLEGWYLFENKKVYKRSLRTHHRPLSSHRLENDPLVLIVEQQVVLKRTKRGSSIGRPNDTAWKRMWYMHCGGANNSVCPTSMRISDAWRAGYAGEGVVVTILDDGIEKSHRDLVQNYDRNASYDINSDDYDPTPRYDHSNENKHGTRCAGVVAATSDNHFCSVGIAWKAKIGGIRMLDGEVTDLVESRSLKFNHQHIDIYSASWGPDDDGMTVEGPGFLAKAAFKEGARIGRGGKGSIFVWASGNGGHNKDTCSCDGYINSIYTIGISSVSQNGKRPWYLESCASTLATTYSSGEANEGKVITTDLNDTCTYAHTGTSASAPMASGVIALMLDANKDLMWRDVQHIIVRTSNPYGLKARDWAPNGAGYNVSHVFGFGLLDAAQLTHVSEKWKTVPEQKQCHVFPRDQTYDITFQRPLYVHVEMSLEACHSEFSEVNFLEHVILRITLTHNRRGDLQIFLTSPLGTKSNILERRGLDASKAGFNEWDFMTTHHWGENPEGLWTLEIHDLPSKAKYRTNTHMNKLIRWELIFYGTATHPQPNFYYDSCDAFPQDQCHKECNGCCGPTELECRSCKNVSTSSGICIPACPSGQFPHPRTKICQSCWKTCKECSAAYEWNCTACEQGFSLVKGSCIEQCAKRFFFDYVSRRCLSCHESCNTCDERRDKCTSCGQGFEHVGDKCNASCPSGTFLLSYKVGCSFCHSSCSECTGSSPNQCTACANGMVLDDRRCIDNCPKRNYYDRVDQMCKACHATCKTCSGRSSHECLSCNSEFALHRGECKRICRDVFYRRSSCLNAKRNGLCTNRHWSWQCCGTCSGFVQ